MQRKILKIVGAELKDKCNSLGLSYPDQLDHLMRNAVVVFDIHKCSTRTKNILHQSLQDRGLKDDDIPALAKTGYFELKSLAGLRNAGTKTIVEIIRSALSLNPLPSLNTGFHHVTSVKTKYIRKIPLKTQRELKKRCKQFNLNWPNDLDVIMTRGVHYFNIEDCSVRAQNVLERSLKKFQLDRWEIEKLADLGFFTVNHLFELRNLGVKTVNELITISLGIGIRENFTLRESNSDKFTPFRTPHTEGFLLFVEHLFEIPDDESFQKNFNPILFGIQSNYCSLNSLYEATYGAQKDNRGACEILTAILESVFQNFEPKTQDTFTTALLNKIDEIRGEARGIWKVSKSFRDFHMLLLLRAGFSLEEIGRCFDLTRERARQITEKEKRKLRNSKNYEAARAAVAFHLEYGQVDQQIRPFLSALYNVFDNSDIKNKTAELHLLKRRLKEFPLLTHSDLLEFLSELGLLHVRDSPEVFESLIIKVKNAHSTLIQDFIANSLGAVSKIEIQDQFPQFSDDQIISYLASLTRKKVIVALGKKGFYISTRKTSLTTSQLTAAGFVQYLLQKDPGKTWSYREIFKLYSEETGLMPDKEGFRGSVQLSREIEKAGIEIFFGRFVIDTKSNIQTAQLFKSCNKQKVITNCIHLNWTEMLESRIPQIAFNLAQKIHESEKILALYINDIFQEKNEEMIEFDSSFPLGSDVMAEIERIAKTNPNHNNPLSAIYSILVGKGQEPDFQTCSKILYHLRRKNLWLE